MVQSSSNQEMAIDSTGRYLIEIGKIPLLSKDEEVFFGKRVQKLMDALKMRELKEKEAKRELGFEEWASALNLDEDKLNTLLNEGKKAKERMIKANLRLVVSVAKKFQRYLALQDLIQEGNLGLGLVI